MNKYAFLAVIGLASTLNPIPVAEVDGQITQLAIGDNQKPVVAQMATVKELAQSEILKLWITAYSSTPEETDDTPFVTALGTEVRDGVIATNLLPFGTKVRIPSLFGDKIFVVEDRMHRRKENFLDIWMPSKEAAQTFGINFAEVVVLN